MIFQLPAGYRPVDNELHVAISNNQIARVDIEPEDFKFPYQPGHVHIDENIANNFTNAFGYLSLDGITFKAEG